MRRREFLTGLTAMSGCSAAAGAPARAWAQETGDFGISRRWQEAALRRLVIVDAEYRRLDVAHHAGRLLMLVLWAQWCPVCRAELPRLAEMQGDVGSDRLRVALVSMFDEWEKDRAYAQARQLPFPLYAYLPIDDATVAAAWRGVEQKDGVLLRTPTAALFLPDGRLGESAIGEIQWTSRDLERMAGSKGRTQEP